MFQSLTSQLGLGAMTVVCGAAVLKGGWPERLTGATLAAAWILSEVLEDLAAGQKIQPAIFAIDCAYAALLAGLLASTDRRWVVWAFAYQMLVVLTHVAAWMSPQVHRFDFFTAYFLWSWATLCALGAGVVLERHDAVGRPGA